jgi:hypothetical protein
LAANGSCIYNTFTGCSGIIQGIGCISCTTFNYKSGNTCIKCGGGNCMACNATKCLRCYASYDANNNGTCVLCSSNSCMSCSSNNTCYDCLGASLSNNVCSSCGASCITCAAGCTTCYIVAFLNSTKSCQTCTMTNCATCLNATACTSCSSGFYLSSYGVNSCVSCAALLGCATCSTSQTCTACNSSSFYLYGGTCYTCGSLMPGCLACQIQNYTT